MWIQYVSVIGTIGALVFGVVAIIRANKFENKDDGHTTGVIMSELGFIKSNVTDVKESLEKMRDDSTEVKVRLAAVEASARQAHKRIDRLDGMPGRDE